MEFRVPLEGSKDVRAPVQMRRTPMALSVVSTGVSDMPSSCEMKDEPEFKPLQGTRTIFSVRASRGPFHLRQKTQGPLKYLLLSENSS